MIIQSDASHMENDFSEQIVTSEDVSLLDGKNDSLEKKYESAEICCQRLEEEKAQLTAQIEELNILYQNQSKELARLKERDRAIMQQFNIISDKSISELRQLVVAQFQELVDQQLHQLRQTYMSQVATSMVRLELPPLSSSSDLPHTDFITLSSAKMQEEEKANRHGSDSSCEENGINPQIVTMEPTLVMCIDNPLNDEQEGDLSESAVSVHELQVDSRQIHELHVELTDNGQQTEEEDTPLSNSHDSKIANSDYEPSEKRRKEA